MKSFRNVCVVLALSAGAASAYASPITFTETVIGSGTFAGQSFTNQLVTLAGSGNTANIESTFAPFDLPLTSATLQIGSGAITTFLNDIAVFDFQAGSVAGFTANRAVDILDTSAAAFGFYTLNSSVSGTGTPIFNSGVFFTTAAGRFDLTSVSGSATFSAQTPTSVTPEPSTMIMVGSGLLGLTGLVRRRFVRA